MLDAIVVGAGIGGLSAAITLGAAGKRVKVFEAAPDLGGKAGVTEIEGVEVDTGPTLLTMPEVFDDVLGLAGMSVAADMPLRRAEPAFRYFWPDGTMLDLHHEVEATLASVRGVLGARAANELEKFLEYASGIWSVARRRFLFTEPPTLATFVRLGIGGLREASRLDAWTTMQRALEARVSSRHLRDVLARYATYNGSDPRRAPATLHCIAHVELVQGGAAVLGGTRALVTALERASRRVGVEIETGTAIRGIRVDRGRVVGVETARGEHVAAGIVVANADVAHVASDLLPRPVSRALERPADLSTSGWCAVIRATRREERAGHTVLFPHDYQGEFVDLFDRGRPPVEPTIYLCAQEKSHGRRGWVSHEPVFVMVNAPAEPVSGRTPDATWAALEARVLERLRHTGLVDPEDGIVWRRTPSDLAERFPGSRGAIYGPASHGIQAAFKRAPNAIAEVPGLYLASGSVHPGGGMPLAALSGMNAARAALKAATADRSTLRMETP